MPEWRFRMFYEGVFTKPLGLIYTDYELVQEEDTIDLVGIAGIEPGSTITARFNHADGTTSDLVLNHSLNKEQIDWFKAGSALNFLRE